MFPAISILGLIIGFVTVVFVTIWLRDEFSYDSFQKKGDRLYRLTVAEDNPETGYHWDFARSHLSWLKNIKSDIPGISELARISRNTAGIVKVKTSVWNQEIFYADPSILQVFTFHFISGNPEGCLSAPHKVVLSESMAKTFFGENDPVGQTVYLYCSNCTEQVPFEVTGVFRDFPAAAHVHFRVLASYTDPDKDADWAYYYILLDANTPPAEILGNFQSFSKKYLSPDYRPTLTPHLQKVTDIHLKSAKERELEQNGSMKQVLWISGLALLVLLISLFNFFNLRYIILIKEFKTVQIMRYTGAKSGNIFSFQFLESFLYSLIAAVIAFVTVYFLYPYFNLLMYKQASAGLSFFVSTSVVTLVILLLVFSLTGVLPYLIVALSSAFRLRRGKLVSPSALAVTGKGSRYTLLRSLVAIQYVLTLILIVSLIGEISQLKLFMNHRLGSQSEKILCIKEVPCQVVDKYRVFKEELLKNPLVEDVTSSMEDPGYEIMDMMGFDTSGVDDKTSNKLLYVCPVDENFFSFYGLRLLAGNSFSPFTGNDSIPVNYILNEKAVKYLGWTNEAAVGKVFRLRNPYIPKTPGRIVGVVSDFQPSSMKNDIKPYAFFRKSFWLYSAQVKYDTTRRAGSLAFIKDTWDEFYPDFPFNYEFVEDLYRDVYKNEIQLKNLSLALSVLALLLSSIGLFGITGMVYETRTKEIGIRKVNGASIGEISAWLLKDIALVVSVAIIIGIPISWFILKNWLQKFANRISLDPWIFIAGGLVILFIALLTVSIQTWRAATRNPVEALRYE